MDAKKEGRDLDPRVIYLVEEWDSLLESSIILSAHKERESAEDALEALENGIDRDTCLYRILQFPIC